MQTNAIIIIVICVFIVGLLYYLSKHLFNKPLIEDTDDFGDIYNVRSQIKTML
jgi:hypothetical protein